MLVVVRLCIIVNRTGQNVNILKQHAYTRMGKIGQSVKLADYRLLFSTQSVSQALRWPVPQLPLHGLFEINSVIYIYI